MSEAQTAVAVEKAKPTAFAAAAPDHYSFKMFDTQDEAEKYASRKVIGADDSWYIYQAVAKADVTTANVVITKL